MTIRKGSSSKVLPFILDGSTGFTLLEKGLPRDALFHKIWSARALAEPDPKCQRIVIDTHKSYLHLGADCVTTSNYGCQPTYYQDAFGGDGGGDHNNLDSEGNKNLSSVTVIDHKGNREIVRQCLLGSFSKTPPSELISREVDRMMATPWDVLMLEHTEQSVRLAKQAIEEYLMENLEKTSSGRTPLNPLVRPLVYGCLPPLVESHQPKKFFKVLRQKGSRTLGERWFINHYKNIARVLLQAEGGVDVLLFETMNCWEEAELGLKALKELANEVAGGTVTGTRVVPVIVCFEGSFRDPQNLKPQCCLCPEIFRKVLRFFEENNMKGPGNNSYHFFLESLGLNCAPPEDIMESLEFCRKDTGGHRQGTNLLDQLKENKIGIAIYATLHERKIYDENPGYSVSNESPSLKELLLSESAHDPFLDVKNKKLSVDLNYNYTTLSSSAQSGDDVETDTANTTDSEWFCRPAAVTVTASRESHYSEKENGYAMFCGEILCSTRTQSHSLSEDRRSRTMMNKYGVTSIGGCCGCGPHGMQRLIKEISTSSSTE